MENVRKLSDVEASFAYSHALMKGTTQVTTHFTVSGEFDPSHVERVAHQWARALPLLSLRVTEQQDELWFGRGPGPEPEQFRHSLRSPENSLDELLTWELNDVLGNGGPLWRLHTVHDPSGVATHFFFTRNHVISDGHSTGAVVRSFLDLLCPEACGTTLSSAYDVCDLPPNADELTYQPPVPPTVMPPPQEAYPKAIPFSARRNWQARSTAFVPLTLSEQESAALRSWCKTREITVNQFFAAALAEAYAQATGRTELSMFTAVSLRRRYAQSALLPDVGCFINVVNTAVRLDDRGLAVNARSYAASFQVADATWRPPQRRHTEIRKAIGDVAAAKAAPGICITNLGVVDPALGPHASRVTGYRTVVNRTDANYGVVLHLATFKGAFGMSLAYGAPRMDEAVVRSVAKALHDRAVRPGGARPEHRVPLKS